MITTRPRLGRLVALTLSAALALSIAIGAGPAAAASEAVTTANSDGLTTSATSETTAFRKIDDVEGTATAETLTVSWAVKDREGRDADFPAYAVLLHLADTGELLREMHTVKRSFTFTGLAEDTDYFVVVYGWVAPWHSGMGSSVYVSTPPKIPAAPVPHAAMGVGEISVYWDLMPGATSYQVTLAGRTCTTSLWTCTFSGLAANTEYTATVVASSNYGSSPVARTSGWTALPDGRIVKGIDYRASVQVLTANYRTLDSCLAVPVRVRVHGKGITSWAVDTTITRTTSGTRVATTRSTGTGNGSANPTVPFFASAAPPGGYTAKHTVTVVDARGTHRHTATTTFNLVGPPATVKVSAVSKASKLKVDVNPDLGSGHWTFAVHKRRADGTWKLHKLYKTQGKSETRTINLPKGRYRVVVSGKHGYEPAVSGQVTLKK